MKYLLFRLNAWFFQFCIERKNYDAAMDLFKNTDWASAAYPAGVGFIEEYVLTLKKEIKRSNRLTLLVLFLYSIVLLCIAYT